MDPRQHLGAEWFGAAPLGEAVQSELAVLYARTYCPAEPQIPTDLPRGGSRHGNTSCGQTDGDVEVNADGSNDC